MYGGNSWANSVKSSHANRDMFNVNYSNGLNVFIEVINKKIGYYLNLSGRITPTLI